LIDLFDVTTMQGMEDGAFVREVLVERTDADASHFGNAVGGHGGSAFPFQDAQYGIEDGIDSLEGAPLLGLTPRGSC
jgi:hypothetical protein